jgi:DNA polymerase-1
MQKFIDNGTRRVLMNYPIQGSAADLMKLAMVQVKKQILDKHPEISLLLQIHDDLVFEVPDDDSTIQKFVPLIKDLMCTVYPLAVPVEVDVKIGKRWGELELQKILQLDK